MASSRSTDALNTILKDWHLWPVLNQWSQSQFNVTPLEKGLTNENWLITPIHPTVGNQQVLQFVLRINAVNAKQLHIDHTAELAFVKAILRLNLCPDITYCDPNNTYWVRPYIEGKTLAELLEVKPALDNETLFNVAQSLKLIHNTPIQQEWPVLDLEQRIDFFWQQIFALNPNETHTLKQLQQLTNHTIKLDKPSQLALCHMDCNIHNWIINQEKYVFLIDWEYAAIGNATWDLAVLCNSAQLNKKQQQQLLHAYGGITTTELQQTLKEMKYLEILWLTAQQHINLKQLAKHLSTINPRD